MDATLPYENMLFIEQFVEAVVSYSSRYNNSMSVSYAPDNVIGKTVKYPNYGDYPDTYMLRSYGKWWNKSEGAQEEYMPQDVGPIVSEDFIIVKYEQPVMATGIKIYETYNPGAVVRIWGGNTNKSWHLLWEGPLEVCEQSSRQFMPPIRVIRELIKYLRIDFNQSLLQYHTSIDGVLLAGYRARYCVKPGIALPYDKIIENKMCKPKLTPVKETNTNETTSCSFSILPYELIVDIFGYLDLRSLCSCAQVNRMFHAASIDSTLYRNLCFKRYWNLMSDQTLECFIPKCNFLRKLDLSWCGYDNMITEAGFFNFLTSCGRHLTHLSLGNCCFIRQQALEHISNCTELIDLRLRNCNPNKSDDFLPLGNLTNLQALDLYLSNIDDQSLARILKNNTNLLHINIDLCEQLTELDLITEVLATYNKNIRTFSCWKGHSLTAEGIKHIAKCSNLRELDVGWCLIINDPGDCLTHLAQGCPKLTKLVISCWRGLGDHQLCPLIRYCTKLKQLDLLGTRNITADICERALEVFTQLELFDVSFCDGITNHQVRNWRQKYRHVTIQRSCEFVVRECFSN